MENDARNRYTRMRIREAFWEKIKKKPIEKITVKEICEKAEINRTTFYYHYHDVYDVYERIQEETIAKFGKLVRNQAMHSRSIEETILLILKTTKEGIPDLPELEYMCEDERFLKKLTEYFGKIFQEEIHRCYADASKEEQKIIYMFIAEGTGAAIRQWMAMGENLPAEQAAKIIAGRIHLG